jgi:adenylate cyclase, class 2
MKNIEIEARFKDIDISEIIKEVAKQGGQDTGEKFLEETIFYDKDLKWRDEGKFARLRTYDGKNIFTYKHIKRDSIDGTEEIEFEVSNPDQLKEFITRMGLIAFRTQQKRRHTLILDGVTLDIDQWPLIPPYLEIEGDSESKIRAVAEKIGLKWENALFIDARKIIEGYGIDVSKFAYFTFEKCE